MKLNERAFFVYQSYVGIKQHFNPKTSYDYIKFRGSIPNLKPSNLNTRHDKEFFYSVARKRKHYEIVPFFIANFIKNENLWIGEFVHNIEADEAYTSWKIKYDRFEQFLYDEIDTVVLFMRVNKLQTFDVLFDCGADGRQHPLFFKLMKQGFISVEFYAALDYAIQFLPPLIRKLENDLIFNNVQYRITQYEKFFAFDKVKFVSKLKKKLDDASLLC